MATRSSLWIAEVKHIDEGYVHCFLGHGVPDAEVRASNCWKVIHWWAFFKHSLLDTVTYRALPWPSVDFSALPESLCISYYEVPISDAGFGLSLYHLTFVFVSLSAFFYCSCQGRLHTQTVPHTYPGWIQLKETLLQKKKKTQSLPLLSKKKHHQSQHH